VPNSVKGERRKRCADPRDDQAGGSEGEPQTACTAQLARGGERKKKKRESLTHYTAKSPGSLSSWEGEREGERYLNPNIPSMEEEEGRPLKGKEGG